MLAKKYGLICFAAYSENLQAYLEPALKCLGNKGLLLGYLLEGILKTTGCNPNQFEIHLHQYFNISTQGERAICDCQISGKV